MEFVIFLQFLKNLSPWDLLYSPIGDIKTPGKAFVQVAEFKIWKSASLTHIEICKEHLRKSLLGFPP